jgi:hypothetical protein
MLTILLFLAPIGYVPNRGDDPALADDHSEVHLDADALVGAVVLPGRTIEHPTSANARLRLRQAVGGDMDGPQRSLLRRELERRKPITTARILLRHGDGTALEVVGVLDPRGLPAYGVTVAQLEDLVDQVLEQARRGDAPRPPRRKKGKAGDDPSLYETDTPDPD